MKKGYIPEGSDWVNNDVMGQEDQRELTGGLTGEALGLAEPKSYGEGCTAPEQPAD